MNAVDGDQHAVVEFVHDVRDACDTGDSEMEGAHGRMARHARFFGDHRGGFFQRGKEAGVARGNDEDVAVFHFFDGLLWREGLTDEAGGFALYEGGRVKEDASHRLYQQHVRRAGDEDWEARGDHDGIAFGDEAFFHHRCDGRVDRALGIDMTNLAMILTGQPLHAFDYDKFIAVGKTRLPEIGPEIKSLIFFFSIRCDPSL